MSVTGGTTGVVQPLSPLTPVVNLTDLYLWGCYLNWVSTTSFSVSVGACRDSSGLTDILLGTSEYSYANQSNEIVTPLPVAVTVSLSATGAGGLDTGTLAASTQYYVYVVGDSKGFLNASVVFSTALPLAGVNTGGATPTAISLPTGPTMPTGQASNGTIHQYDCFRYIGSISTDASSHVRPFVQTGATRIRTVYFDPGTGPSTKGVTIPSSGTSGSTTYVNVGVLTTLMPQTASEAILNVKLTPNTAGNYIFLASPTVDNGTTATVGSMAAFSASVVSTGFQDMVVRVPVNVPNSTQRAALTIGAVNTALYATSEASDVVAFLLNGYVDRL